MASQDDDDISLPSHFRKVPLEALNVSVRKKLSLFLNIERLPNEEGIIADFNGLAEQIGFSYMEIQNFGRPVIKDPTSEVLNEWTRRPDLLPTVDNLFKYLLKMDRVDILADCRRGIISDIEHYISMQERKQDEFVPLQDNTISQSEADYTSSYPDTDHGVDEYRYMTVQDVENDEQTFYDAFICYDPEGYDLQFVKKMLSELESPKYGLRLFVPWRDDLPGSSTYTVSAKLIQDRCRRMVIIMSPRFLKSPACDFQIKFAHSLSPGSRSKKLVPVLITPCPIPQILRHVTLCDFTKRDLMEWFWIRLARAIKAPLNFEELQINDKICLDEITLNIEGKNVHYNNIGEKRNSSSSQPLPIIPVPSRQQSGQQCSPGSGMSHSPMELSGCSPDLSSMSSMPSMSSMHSLNTTAPMSNTTGSQGQSASYMSVDSSPQPPPRGKRDKIPKLFPSSQC